MTPHLATVNGVTRDEAHENYMRALAELVTYSVAVSGWRESTAYIAYQHRIGMPRPSVIDAVVGIQARTFFAANPPMVRTIEIVGS